MAMPGDSGARRRVRSSAASKSDNRCSASVSICYNLGNPLLQVQQLDRNVDGAVLWPQLSHGEAFVPEAVARDADRGRRLTRRLPVDDRVADEQGRCRIGARSSHQLAQPGRIGLAWQRAVAAKDE